MLALEVHCLGEGLRPPGAYLDLRGNQLPGGRLGQQLVLKAGCIHVLEAVAQVEAIRIDDRELLLEADREIRRGLEQLPRSRQVEVARALGVVSATAAHQDPRTSPSIKSLLELGARDSPYASGQVEVERVEEIDRWAGRVHGHVWRHLEQ